MKEIMDGATDPWGIRVEMVEVKDVKLPIQMQRAMAAEAEAEREAKAKIVAAEGEKNAAVALKEASDTISDGGCALQLPLELLPLELLPLELLGKGFLRDKEEK